RRAPVIVTVVYRPSTNPRATEVEDRYAVGAAMENALLAAHSLGLGAYLRTGPAALDPVVHRFLELVEGEEIAGFIYVGYPAPDEQAHLSERHPVAEVTTWRGWNT
ncbi:MAG TPA: nitroreductase family protein, partial [Actinomycetota bacterium]|nr:nitroreductase family protein [Actinomycetota bacterium]